MKKILAIIMVLLFCFPAWAQDETEKIQIISCPETTMQRDCLKCHVIGDFRVRETAPDADLIYPNDSIKIVDGSGYFYLTEIDSKSVKQFFDYLNLHGIKRAVIEIHSPGGALFDAQRIVGLIRSWQKNGGHVTMKLYGAAFSAGFYVFTAGDVRLVDEYADLMWHELKALEVYGFKISTPSDKEEEARVLRHLQNIRNEYLSTRGKLSKKELDEMISRKEFWMSGLDAVKYGFADGCIK